MPYTDHPAAPRQPSGSNGRHDPDRRRHLTWDLSIPETDIRMSELLPSAQGTPATSLLGRRATVPGADPCDIAEDAMPALVIGDLAPPDAEWVHDHTATCGYCHDRLQEFEEVGNALACCDMAVRTESPQRRPATSAALGIPEARYGFMDTPVGTVLIAVSDAGVCEISYLDHTERYESLRQIEQRGFILRERQGAVTPVIDELETYFAGDRRSFDLGVDLAGVTDFTRSVLKATSYVPYGKVTTYGEIATMINRPSASRAVGNALGRNPVPVVIPCHRVVLANGEMGWYTGGPHIKAALLDIEGVHLRSGQRADQRAGQTASLQG
jgi:methylated-DNA-[protein]-cysteine S-methyltransferase